MDYSTPGFSVLHYLKERYLITIKTSVHPKDIVSLYVYASNNITTKYMKHRTAKKDKSTILIRDFNSPLSLFDITIIRRIRKDAVYMNITIKQLDLKTFIHTST